MLLIKNAHLIDPASHTDAAKIFSWVTERSSPSKTAFPQKKECTSSMPPA